MKGSLVVALTQYTYDAKVEVISNHIKTTRLHRKVLEAIEDKTSVWCGATNPRLPLEALGNEELQESIKKKTKYLIDIILAVDNRLYCSAVAKDTMPDTIEMIITFNTEE